MSGISQSRIGSWADAAEGRERLQSAGMRGAVAASKAELFRQCARRLAAGGLAEKPATALFVPGRIEVLGKHTDYAGGRSVVAAVERGFCLLSSPREDAAVVMTSADSGECCRFDLSPDLAVPTGTWFNYPMTAGRRLARNFPLDSLRGSDIAFASDLPPASGMSSSSALLTGAFLALSAASDLPNHPAYRAAIDRPEALAEYLGCVENGQSYRALTGDRGVGTFGGSEDHTAMLCCKAGALSQYSYRPLRFERLLPLAEGWLFAVGSSGVTAEKTGGAMELYNRASRLAGAVAKTWREATGGGEPHMAAILRGGAAAAGRLREALASAGLDAVGAAAGAAKEAGGAFAPADLLRRFEHFQAESEEIIPAAGDALLRGDIAEFGRQVDRSQSAAETLLCNQVSETVFLSKAARRLGAAAASAFGAGFGGSVWALVRREEGESFIQRWRGEYAAQHPSRMQRAEFFLTGAGAGARTIADSGFRIAD